MSNMVTDHVTAADTYALREQGYGMMTARRKLIKMRMVDLINELKVNNAHSTHNERIIVDLLEVLVDDFHASTY